jgi:O-antigen/teichoic acid export membrane protein
MLCFKPQIVSFRVNFKGVKAILSANLLITLNAGMRRLILVLPEVLIGIVSTTTNAAMYSRGSGVVNFGLSILQKSFSPIITPYFALENNENNGANSAFILVNTLMGVILFPFLIGVTVLADELVHIMLGSQWIDAAYIASIISMAMLFKFFYSYFNEFLITIGKEKVLAKIQLFELIILATSCILIAFVSAQLIPYALLITFILSFLLKSFFLHTENIKISLHYLSATKINYLISGAIFLIVWGTKYVLISHFGLSSVWVLMSCAILAFLGWAVLLLLLKHSKLVVIKRLLNLS